MSQLCPQCSEENAIIDGELGLLPGLNCQNVNKSIPKPKQSQTYSFASPTTKKHRVEYGAEMYQPYINGQLSREFVETFGTSKLEGVTKEDIKKSKYVYGEMPRSHIMLRNGKAKFKGGKA